MIETEKADGQVNKKELTTFNMVAVAAIMSVLFGLLGFGLTTAGIAIAGTTGKWIGLFSAFAVLSLICYFIWKKYSHQSLTTICVIFVVLGASKVGEEIGKDIGTQFAVTWGQWIAGAIAFLLLFMIGNVMNKGSENQIEDLSG